jgi:fucose permease
MAVTGGIAGRSRSRGAVSTAWAGFLLIGWAGVLPPSLVRQVEGHFGVDDAAIGIWYLATSLSYASGSFAGGILTERIGRRRVLLAGSVMLGSGYALLGVAPSWAWFLLAGPLQGFGSGSIDGGLNGLILDVAGDGPGRAVSLLHLCFSIGAFVSPFVVGRLVSAGVQWQLVILATGVAILPIAGALSRVQMPSGRHHPAPAPVIDAVDTAATASSRLPLALLAVGIACYVASEVGVSNWMVRFLARANLDTATLALSGFWAGLALGRLAGSRLADRVAHGRFAVFAALGSGAAVIAAVASPSIELSIVAFVVAGFAMGPVFPMIVVVGGELYADRLATTAGTLTAVAILGATIYPPLIGLMSASLGIGAGIFGAGLLAFTCAASVYLGVRAARA